MNRSPRSHWPSDVLEHQHPAAHDAHAFLHEQGRPRQPAGPIAGVVGCDRGVIVERVAFLDEGVRARVMEGLHGRERNGCGSGELAQVEAEETVWDPAGRGGRAAAAFGAGRGCRGIGLVSR